MSTIIYPAPIFGPVHSRRLGVSLGINLLPGDGKFCTFDCIYCECGYNKDFRPKQKVQTREAVREALEKRLAEEREYDRVRLEVTRFKADVLNLYRSHVESLSRLPEFQKETAAQDAEQAEPAAEESEPAAAAQPQAADVQEPEAEPAQPAQEDAEPAAAAEDDSKAADSSEDFWAKDESQLKLDPPPADMKPDEPDYDAFQGVKFSE